MLQQPDQLRACSLRNGSRARVHGGNRRLVRHETGAQAPLGRRAGGRLQVEGEIGAGLNHLVTIPLVTSPWSRHASSPRAAKVATLEKASLEIAVVLGTTSMLVHQLLRRRA